VKDYYKILGVSDVAEIEVITAAYRAMMRKYHPDTNPSPSSGEKAKEINEAYEVLRDAGKRRSYDQQRQTSKGGQSQEQERARQERERERKEQAERQKREQDAQAREQQERERQERLKREREQQKRESSAEKSASSETKNANKTDTGTSSRTIEGWHILVFGIPIIFAILIIVVDTSSGEQSSAEIAADNYDSQAPDELKKEFLRSSPQGPAFADVSGETDTSGAHANEPQPERVETAEEDVPFADTTSASTPNLSQRDFEFARSLALRGYPNAKVSHLVGPDIPLGASYSGFIIGLTPSAADALAVKGKFSAALELYLQNYKNNNDAEAAHNIGLIYSRGLGVKRNKKIALSYLEFSYSNRRWDADSWEISKLR
jgi:hypothetical protein